MLFFNLSHTFKQHGVQCLASGVPAFRLVEDCPTSCATFALREKFWALVYIGWPHQSKGHGKKKKSKSSFQTWPDLWKHWTFQQDKDMILIKWSRNGLELSQSPNLNPIQYPCRDLKTIMKTGPGHSCKKELSKIPVKMSKKLVCNHTNWLIAVK